MISHSFLELKDRNFPYQVFSPLKEYDFLFSGFVTKNQKLTLGDLNEFLSGQLRREVTLAVPRQSHSNKILVIRKKEDLRLLKSGYFDGLLTNLKNIFLCVQVADCVPIFMVDHKKKVVGLIHGGWRGGLQGIAGRSISQMVQFFKSDPEDIVLVFGPFIQSCCYKVCPSVAVLFGPDCLRKDKDTVRLDLGKVLAKQFVRTGVKRKNIFISEECTFCNVEEYYSYRREKDKSKRMIGFIGRIK